MSEWKEVRFDEIGDVFSGGTPSTTNPELWDGDIAFVTPYDLSKTKTPYIKKTQRYITKKGLEQSSANLLPTDSLILSSRAPIGYIALSETEFVTNQGCKSLRFFENQEPLFHYYNLQLYVDLMKRYGVGTTFAEISKGDLAKLKINIPKDKAKQKQIAQILTTCDTVIEQTQAAIEKYKAIKQGMLHDLFTRGLTASGQLRPTPQQAPELYKQSELGLIPKEWEVKRLGKYLISLEAGVSVNSTDTSTTDDIAVLKTSAVFNGTFNPNENKKVITKDIERVKTNPKADSIIISRMNTPMLVGECGYVDRDYPLLFLPDRLWQTVFLDKKTINVRWVNYLLNTENYSKTIKDSATGTSDSMKNITKDVFFNLRIPYMHIDEQNNITEKLKSIDTKLQSEEALLSKYQSIKKGLMSDLLSGKREVTL